jgi:hypothetical protein
MQPIILLCLFLSPLIKTHGELDISRGEFPLFGKTDGIFLGTNG